MDSALDKARSDNRQEQDETVNELHSFFQLTSGEREQEVSKLL